MDKAINMGKAVATASRTLKGRTYSIIGDSISTYAGHVPDGYLAFYPTYSAALRSVDDTWWRVMERLTGLTLLKNCSWGGKGMCGPSGSTTDASAGCSTARIAALAEDGTKPDVVIVYNGINDFNNSHGYGSTLGTWKPSDALPAEGTILDFRAAYALGIAKVMAAYPDAEVYCCTLLETTDPAIDKDNDGAYPVTNLNGETIADYNAAIREIAPGLGARLIDLHACGVGYFNASGKLTDGVHPTAIGMELMGRCVATGIMRQTAFGYGAARYAMQQGIGDAAFMAQTAMLVLGNSATSLALVANRFADLQGLAGRPIYGVRMRFGTSGKYYVVRAEFTDETTCIVASVVDVAELTVASGDVGKVMTFMFAEPVVLGANEKLVFCGGTNLSATRARPYYGAGGHRAVLSTNTGASFAETDYLTGVDYVI